MAGPGKGKKQQVIGVMVDSLNAAYHFEILNGIEAQAARDGYLVQYFVGKPFNIFKTEFERSNIIYDLISNRALDFQDIPRSSWITRVGWKSC